MFVYTIQPVVNPVIQPVVSLSCKRGMKTNMEMRCHFTLCRNLFDYNCKT